MLAIAVWGLVRSHDSTTATNAVIMIASVNQYKTGLLVFSRFVANLISCLSAALRPTKLMVASPGLAQFLQRMDGYPLQCLFPLPFSFVFKRRHAQKHSSRVLAWGLCGRVHFCNSCVGFVLYWL